LWSKDIRGHGTHVTGTIIAANNNIGVVGIGRIPVFITRALNNQGQARESDIMEAIMQCESSGAKVLSLSIGGNSISTAFSDLMDSLYAAGWLIFAASGNDGQNLAKYPGAHPKVVSVGAIQQDGSHWSGSNWGSWVETAAPGVMIYSTTVDGNGNPIYAYYSGTSMATPHASGVAALVWSHFPECNNNQIRVALAQTAYNFATNTPGCDEYYGYGVPQAKAAFDYLTANPCATSNTGAGVNIQGGCNLVNEMS
jgi:serine protease